MTAPVRLEDVPRLYTYAEVAAQLGVSERTLGRWRAEGTIPVIELGTRVRWTAEDVQAIQDARRVPARAKAQQRRAQSIARGRRGLTAVRTAAERRGQATG